MAREKVGYLSMDTCRRLIPLLADDSCARSMTLVGIWISGLTNLLDPITLAASLRFHFTSKIHDKATQDQAFLVLFFGVGEYSVKLYECKVEASEHIKLAIYSCRTFGRNCAKMSETKVKWKLEKAKHSIQIPCLREIQKSEVRMPKNETPSKREAAPTPKNSVEDVPFSFMPQRQAQAKRKHIHDEVYPTPDSVHLKAMQKSEACLESEAVECRSFEISRPKIQCKQLLHENCIESTWRWSQEAADRQTPINRLQRRSPCLGSEQGSIEEDLPAGDSLFCGFDVENSSRSSTASPISDVQLHASLSIQRKACKTSDGDTENAPSIPRAQDGLEQVVYELQAKV